MILKNRVRTSDQGKNINSKSREELKFGLETKPLPFLNFLSRLNFWSESQLSAATGRAGD